MKGTIELEDKELSEEMTKSKSKREPPTGLRLPDGMKEAIEERAELEGVSVGEACRRLIRDGLDKNPADKRRTLLLKSLAVTADQFENALKEGVLKDTDAEKQADEIRKFFGQFADVLKGEKKEE